MKKIGIDCRFSSSPTGLGRYVRELVPALVSQQSNIEWVLFVRSQAEHWLQDLPNDIRIETADIPHYSLAEQWQWPKCIQAAGINELFVPHFNAPLRCPVPFVVVIHDLILHRYPNQASLLKQIAYRVLMKNAVKNAKAIIAVSEFTASEIKQQYTVEPIVITEAVGSAFRKANEAEMQKAQQKFSLPKKYYLYVGNAKQHKNVQVLTDAFTQAHLTDTELLLVSPGKEAQQLSLPQSVRILENVTDSDLPALYTSAQAFVTASLYEGFCLPVLEALACECPVIAANTSAIKELQTDGVQLVEPTIPAYTYAFENFNRPSKIKKPTRTWNAVASDVLSIL